VRLAGFIIEIYYDAGWYKRNYLEIALNCMIGGIACDKLRLSSKAWISSCGINGCTCANCGTLLVVQMTGTRMAVCQKMLHFTH
jgi:hypothetical protein